MKLNIFLILIFFVLGCSTTKNLGSNNEQSQIKSKEEIPLEVRPVYRASETILTDLIHTKLQVNFNWKKSEVNGSATIKAKPYFFSSDSLILDAKGMEIHTVQLNNQSLNFKYTDKAFLRIKLDTVYTKKDTFEVTISYTAKPEEMEQGGSAAITSDKGLYFINPTGEDTTKMPQIWTQGETEASSVWFPTIDAPNQKMTQEIEITVDNKYVTLSNGKLVSQHINENGTRTDHWKQNLPHVPYLAMMAVGEFKKVEDSFTKKDGSTIAVDYYVEPEWETSAKAIFGTTPEMIGYFSDLLGVEYPWDKYSQIVVRDYVSGAMENTGAVIFGDYAYKNERELLDANDQSTIAHELFHHWFGDLVTCESWANLPLNESWANYSQYLWDEYKYGSDEADYNATNEAQGYYSSAQTLGHHDLIWFDYSEKEKMFDGHSYNKGGRILHMLRNYLGDEAFFEGAKLYLTENQYKPAEVHHLRLAFEEVSGEDLNWFFNQWFFASHNPVLKIEQAVKDHTLTLDVLQKQNLEVTPLYKLPVKIDVYTSTGKKSFETEINKSKQKIEIDFEGELKNVVFDAERILLAKITFNKPENQFIHQFYNAPKYMDRLEAVTNAAKTKTEQASKLLLDALNDPFWGIRLTALDKANAISSSQEETLKIKLFELAETDDNSKVRARAISYLSSNYAKDKDAVKALLVNKIENDLSYTVLGSALLSLGKIDEELALKKADSLKNDASSSLLANIGYTYYKYGDSTAIPFMFETLELSQVREYDAISMLGSLSNTLIKQDALLIENYIPRIAKLDNLGSSYVKVMLPINVRGMQTQLTKKIDKLNKEYDAEMELKNVAVANKIKQKKESLEKVWEQLNTLSQKLKKF